MKGSNKSLISSFPWNATESQNDALTMQFTIANDTDLKLYRAIFIHSPDEPPLFLHKEDAVEFDGGKSLDILLTPNVITTDIDLAGFDLQDRVCFLDGEKYLRFFKAYTTKNCLNECFSNVSAEICGCVPFDIIRDELTPICELFDYHCLNRVQYEIKFDVESEKLKECNCLQRCNSVTYDVEFIESLFAKTYEMFLLKVSLFYFLDFQCIK
jgi:hypothetical protein